MRNVLGLMAFASQSFPHQVPMTGFISCDGENAQRGAQRDVPYSMFVRGQ
jgi:hypothetical protein